MLNYGFVEKIQEGRDPGGESIIREQNGAVCEGLGDGTGDDRLADDGVQEGSRRGLEAVEEQLRGSGELLRKTKDELRQELLRTDRDGRGHHGSRGQAGGNLFQDRKANGDLHLFF